LCKTKFNPIHLMFPKGLESLNTSKESVWNRPDRLGMSRTTQNMGAGLGNLPWARQTSCTRIGSPALGKPSIFHPKIPFLNPFTPKLIHLITNIKRHSKQQQTTHYNTNSSQNHHLAHFHQKPTFFSFFIQTSKQPYQFKFHQHTNINKD